MKLVMESLVRNNHLELLGYGYVCTIIYICTCWQVCRSLLVYLLFFLSFVLCELSEAVNILFNVKMSRIYFVTLTNALLPCICSSLLIFCYGFFFLSCCLYMSILLLLIPYMQYVCIYIYINRGTLSLLIFHNKCYIKSLNIILFFHTLLLPSTIITFFFKYYNLSNHFIVEKNTCSQLIITL